MKIAICLYGEFREFEYTSTSLSIWEKFNPDYYVSTWNVSKQTSDSLKIEIIEKIDKSKILKHLPNASISVLDKIKNKDHEFLLHHHWRNLIKMLKNSKSEYDLVIFRRIDLFMYDFFEEEFLNTNFEKNTIYIPAGLCFKPHNDPKIKAPFIDDNLFICDTESIIKFIDELPNESMSTHFGIARSLINSNINIKDINFISWKILRPTMREYITNDYEKNCEFLKDNVNFQSYYDKWCNFRNV